MAKIAVFIDHDIVIRHFVANEVLSDLEKEHDLFYVFPEKHRRVTVDLETLPVPRFRTVKVLETRAYHYRRLYHATVLKRMRSTKDKMVAFEVWRGMLGFRGFWESWFYSWPMTYEFYRKRMLDKIGDNLALHDLLKQEKPDLILHPQLPITPRVIHVPAEQRTAPGQASYANSITLTPGTISLEVSDDEIEVHALSEDAAEDLQSGEMGRRVVALETH